MSTNNLYITRETWKKKKLPKLEIKANQGEMTNSRKNPLETEVCWTCTVRLSNVETVK